MVITANSGPTVNFGLTRSASGQVQEYNENRGPSVYDAGVAIADPRGPYNYQPGSGSAAKTWGWNDSIGKVDAKPGTFTLVTLVSCVLPVSGTAMVLNGSTGCITAGVTLYPASANTMGSGVSVSAIDSTYATVPVGLACGQTGAITAWDPQLAVTRGLTFVKSTTSADDSTATYTIQGYDLYGYKMTETITGTSSTGSSVYNTVKAFKYIQSITPGGTVGATAISVYPNNMFGFPLPVRSMAQTELWMGLSTNLGLVATQSTLITLAATLTPTATGPDVRGTWSSTNTSSVSSNFMVIKVQPRAQDVNAMTLTYSSTGAANFLGIDQYSS